MNDTCANIKETQGPRLLDSLRKLVEVLALGTAIRCGLLFFLAGVGYLLHRVETHFRGLLQGCQAFGDCMRCCLLEQIGRLLANFLQARLLEPHLLKHMDL